MNKKITKLSIFILCLVFETGSTNFNEDDIVSFAEMKKISERLKTYNIRCSRRFTPGVCLNPVTPVWTFNFQIPNCTERLGCASSHRTNRFRDYRSCMRRCHTLVDLYLQILADDANNNSQLFNYSEAVPLRREGSDRFIVTPSPSSEEYIDESSGDEAINTQIYGDGVNFDDDKSEDLYDVGMEIPSYKYF